MRFKDHKGQEGPYVPPGCPASGEYRGEINDWPFLYAVTDHGAKADGTPEGNTVEGWFYKEAKDGDDLTVGTQPVEAPFGSELETAATSVYRYPDFDGAMGDWFASRVEECHGITPDGQCWALGADAMREAIERFRTDRGDSDSQTP